MKTKLNKKTNIPRIVILQKIFENLAQVKQWARFKCYDTAAKYEQRTKSLIELLEVIDCGSFGGFDIGQQDTDRSLFGRFIWLLNKYNTKKDLNQENYKFEDVEKFFHENSFQ